MLLKQRNIVVRPDTAEKAELEIKKLEHFGWLRVRDKKNDDGTVLVSLVRDEDECADKVESEGKYRSAKVASAYAAAALENLQSAKEHAPAKKKKGGIASLIIFSFIAAIFVAAAVVPFVWQTLICDYVFTGNNVAQLGGDWTFFGFARFNFANSGLVVLSLLFACVLCLFALLFVVMGLNSFSKKRNTFDEDYETVIADKIAYFEEVQAVAAADVEELYPAQN